MIEFDCAHCGHHFRAKETHVGRRFRCRTCGALLTVPELHEGPGGGLGSASQPLNEESSQELSFTHDETPSGVRALELELAGNAETIGAQADQIESLREERARLARQLCDAEALAADMDDARARAETERDTQSAARERAESQLTESRTLLNAAHDQSAALERAESELTESRTLLGAAQDQVAALERAREEVEAEAGRTAAELTESRALLGTAQDQVAALERAWEEAKAEAVRAEVFIADLHAAEQALEDTRALVAGMATQVAAVTQALAAAGERPAAKREPGLPSAPSREPVEPESYRAKQPPVEDSEPCEGARDSAKPASRYEENVSLIPEVVQDARGGRPDDLVDGLMRFLEPE
jgi:hypothetical protein